MRADLAPAFRALADHGLVFDALVHPRHLSRLLVVADRHPDLAIVVDHGAKPFIRERRLDPWRADMAALAARPNVVCKLSGLATEAAADWRPEDLRPYVDHLMGAFGAGRLLWGSDWPVVNLAGGYDRWRAASLEWLQGVFGERAQGGARRERGADLSRRPGTAMIRGRDLPRVIRSLAPTRERPLLARWDQQLQTQPRRRYNAGWCRRRPPRMRGTR